MKDIMLKITGKTVTNEGGRENSEDVVEFVTEGKFYGNGDSVMLSYPETELSGLEGWTTYLTFNHGKVKMKRSDGVSEPQTIMEFEKGRRYKGEYPTPYGSVEIELLTNSIKPFTAEDQKMSIDYSVSLKGLMQSRNKLDIEILQ